LRTRLCDIASTSDIYVVFACVRGRVWVELVSRGVVSAVCVLAYLDRFNAWGMGDLASPNGLWPNLFEATEWDESFEHGDSSLLAVALGRWEFLAADASSDVQQDARMLEGARARIRGKCGSTGFLVYRAVDLLELTSEVFHACVGKTAATILNEIRGISFCRADVHGVYSGYQPLHFFLEEWRRLHDISASFMVSLHDSTCEAVVDGLRIFHAVALGKSAPFQRLVIGGYPSNKVIASWIRDHPAAAELPALVGSAARPRQPNEHPVDDVLSWLRATRHLKFIRSTKVATRDWITLIAKKGPEPVVDMRMRMQPINYDTLRRARVRLDCIACLLFRLFFTSMALLSLNFYVYTDASPQWRGIELMAPLILPMAVSWTPNVMVLVIFAMFLDVYLCLTY
jgi:hypothetical protein